MSTHSLVHQSSSLGFTPLFRASRKHMGGFSCYRPRMKNSIDPNPNLEDENPLFLQVSKTLSSLEQKYQKTSENSVGRSLDKPSTSSCSVSLGDIVPLRGIIRLNADCSFHPHFYPAPSRLCILEQRVECVPSVNRQACLAILRLQLLRSFQPFCSILHLSVHVSTKTSNT
ncbi:hypothetical protein H5410_056254 [Solanum commersonii]|uniref:Uncharacterized protein n=1 Tax=Solanum commersonii TaxID=4109 RepID=A0A9J5WM68_SOLCO|nr:hypothetical protein H5410_056254 [Solanum commersonii]